LALLAANSGGNAIAGRGGFGGSGGSGGPRMSMMRATGAMQ